MAYFCFYNQYVDKDVVFIAGLNMFTSLSYIPAHLVNLAKKCEFFFVFKVEAAVSGLIFHLAEERQKKTHTHTISWFFYKESLMTSTRKWFFYAKNTSELKVFIVKIVFLLLTELLVFAGEVVEMEPAQDFRHGNMCVVFFRMWNIIILQTK